MNELHLIGCASPEWAAYVETELLPWVLGDRSLGDDVLEVGPGPGRTTDVLRARVARLTALEVDPDLAATLAARLAGTNVEVVEGDGTALPFEDDRFSAAAVLSMLHHVPSVELQDRLLAGLHRVLQPGGLLVGTDAVESPMLWEVHQGDTYVPVDPDRLPARLERAGFTEVEVARDDERFRFACVK